MPLSKLPKRSKIILSTLTFLVTLYLLVVGFSYLKAWYDFRPYHKLAVELNDGLGGGYAISETKNCGIDTPNCPSARLLKNVATNSVDDAKKQVELQSAYFDKTGYSHITAGICEDIQGIGVYCSLTAVSDGVKLKVTVNIKNDFVGVDITK